MADLVEAHDSLRPLMFSIAYRMLGSVTEAEDIVQDAFLKMHKSVLDGVVIDSQDAFAATVTTRLAIDALRSARRNRERYIGPWMPEPLIDSPEGDPGWQVERDETVSVAFLAVLERLSPTERAVFLLREVFGYEYAEIAGIVEKGEQNCRQIFARANRRLAAERPRFEPSAEERDRLAVAFFDASRSGNLQSFEQVLAEDVVFYADGGGLTAAIREPMNGVTAVARFLVGLGRAGSRIGAHVEPVQVNGQPGARVVDDDGALLSVLSLGIADGRVVSVVNQLNPAKLRHLGRVGDLVRLLREGGER